MTALRLAGAAELTMVVQPFVDGDDRRTDVRVYCVDRAPVGALRRSAGEGGTVANISAGGTGELIPVPAELHERAAAIAAHLDAPWLGVDFLCNESDQYLSEVEIDACIGPVTSQLPGMDAVLSARFGAYLADYERWLRAGPAGFVSPTATRIRTLQGSPARCSS